MAVAGIRVTISNRAKQSHSEEHCDRHQVLPENTVGGQGFFLVVGKGPG